MLINYILLEKLKRKLKYSGRILTPFFSAPLSAFTVRVSESIFIQTTIDKVNQVHRDETAI